MTANTFREHQVKANGLNFTYIEEGEGPLLLCLHGFPDHALSFRPQLQAFSRLGYRVVAPYMRGYAPSDVPADGSYHSAALGQDVVGLIDALGGGHASVIGHDWGAVAAYSAAVLAPEKIEKLVTLAIPFGAGFGKALIVDPDQQRRSWYMFFFLSRFAETALAYQDFAFVDRLWSEWSPGFDLPAEDMEALKATFRKPGVAKATLNYYRHTFGLADDRPESAEWQARLNTDPVQVPTLYLHGADDGCIGSDVGGDFGSRFPAGLRQEIVTECGHFLHLEKPDAVNALISSFLGQAPSN